MCFVDDDAFAVEAARVTLTLQGAAPLTVAVDVARGASAKPLTDQDLEEKLRVLCRDGGSGCNPARLIDAVWSLDTAEDAGAIMRLAAGRG